MTTLSRTRQLAIADHRTAFILVAVHWRVHADMNVESHVTSLMRHVETRSGVTPVTMEWCSGEGFLGAVVTLPPTGAPQWTEALRTASKEHPEMPDPFLASVGPSPEIFEMERFVSVAGESTFSPPTELQLSTLRRSEVSGFEQLFISGEDPAQTTGQAATFLAMCLLSGGPGTIFPDAVTSAHHRAMLQVNRTLSRGVPRINWQLIVSGQGGLPIMAKALAQVESVLGQRDAERLHRARKTGTANLRRPWCSPRQLVRSLAEYETSGWGAQLLLDPEATLNDVTDAEVQHAAEALLRPLREVLGHT